MSLALTPRQFMMTTPAVFPFSSRQFLAGETCELELPFTPPAGEQRWLALLLAQVVATTSRSISNPRPWRNEPDPFGRCDVANLSDPAGNG